MSLVALPGAVAADTEYGHTGNVGVHRLRDAVGYPGARCNHTGASGDEVLTSIRVRAPIVYARNATSGLDIQTVGWRAVLQHKAEGSTTWVRLAAAAIQKDSATDQHPAEFTSQTFSNSRSGEFRVFAEMFWYSGTAVAGKALHRVDRHAILINGVQVHEQSGYCHR